MFTSEQRRWQADKIGDLGNYIIVGLIINQIVAQAINLPLIVTGVIMSAFCFRYSNYILRYLTTKPFKTEDD